MRIVFLGASELGWECCRALFEIGEDVVGILSIPREFRISWSPAPVNNVRFKSFEDLAAAHSVPLMYVTKPMSDPSHRDWLAGVRPDLLVVIGWYYMIPWAIRDLAPHGAVGVHASLLPKFRGGAPLVWAMINGETRTGVTLFHLADGLDDGDIVGQADFEIGFGETIADVVRKATAASCELVRAYIPQLTRGTAPRRPQDHSQATVVAQRKPEDGLIDWRSKSALEAYNWVRAQTRPYPGAFTYLDGENVTIWAASVRRDADAGEPGEPGTVAPAAPGTRDAFGVWCADGGVLSVHEIGVPEGQVMSGAEFLAARGVAAGTVLGA